MTLIPAYNRDYTNKNDVLKDFNDNKDFIINDIFSPYDGKPCNKRDLKNEGLKDVQIRFKQLRNIIIAKVI